MFCDGGSYEAEESCALRPEKVQAQGEMNRSVTIHHALAALL